VSWRCIQARSWVRHFTAWSRCIQHKEIQNPAGIQGGISTLQTLRSALGLRSTFSQIAIPTLGIAMLAVLTIARPLQAQSDQGLIPVFQQDDARVNLQDNYIPVAAFTFAGRGTPAVARDGAGTETEVPPQTSLSNPFTTFTGSWRARDSSSDVLSALKPLALSGATYPDPGEEDNKPGKNSKESSNSILREYDPSDRNRSIYYKNKLEFSLEGGWLPINIPFPFDFLLGDGYNFPGLYYTLVPIMASVRWHLDDVRGPWILRGNWDTTFTANVTVIPRGAETRYFSYIMEIRRNFVPRRGKVAPYLDGAVGLGDIDAKGPLGVAYAQGQNFTFTMNLGSGVRYNFNPRYSIQAGLHWMHISNLYLSQPTFLNYGINVYGPWFGINIRFGKHRPAVQ